ncbi:cell death-inducing p53-target protein 1 homolog isoform X1 [Saccostrea cucullata]|uniref:cell death-inducing p53-target protein 1 homolog isoform X1 n=2 Tax=Saccostrea cuccullata TaxID=36930 RepID=UPI002ED2D983
MSAPPPYPGTEKQGGPPPPPPPGQGVPPPAGYQPMYGQPTASYQPGYQPMMGHASVTVVHQPGMVITQQFREHPVRTKCPACQAEILTSTSYETGTFAWVIALVLCLFGLWLGCCLIPFCVDGCKDVVHSCPNCRHTIGKFNRM